MFIASFILQCLKKKPVNALGAYLAQWCIEAIDLAEKSDVKGSEKLAIAVQYVFKRMLRNFPNIDVESYREHIIQIIETLLTLPQKHDN